MAHGRTKEQPGRGGGRGGGTLALLLVGGAAAGLALAAPAIVERARRARPKDDAPPHAGHGDRFGKYDVVGRSVTIARPRAELFAYWRDFRNLPQFMDNVEQVVPVNGSGRAEWHIVGPGGRTIAVETEVAAEEVDRLIAWRSVPGSEIDTEGRVEFHNLGERGTRVRLIIAYRPPFGELGRIVAKIMRREPEIQARHDLKRFKMIMETGEVATSQRFAGQES